MISVNLHEAKTHLSSLISSVEHQGERVIILKHGVAVAELVPVSYGKRTAVHEELKNIHINFDPLEPTAGEWLDV